MEILSLELPPDYESGGCAMLDLAVPCSSGGGGGEGDSCQRRLKSG